MKNIKIILTAIICITSVLVFSQKTKDITADDLMPNKKRTCWDVTKGTAAFGANICFNPNSTANHATGGFGGYRLKGNEISMVDLNGKSSDSQKRLVFKLKSASKTKLVFIDEKNAEIELTLKK